MSLKQSQVVCGADNVGCVVYILRSWRLQWNSLRS